MMKTRWLWTLGMMLLASCSPYQRDFRKSVAAGIPASSPAGAWKGMWKSQHNGHQGPLWCLVSPGKRPGYWDFRYRAGWGVLQFGDYTHSIPARLRTDESLPIKGTMTLPKGFGTYTVNGKVTATSFKTRYNGNNDHGVMELKRPQ